MFPSHPVLNNACICFIGFDGMRSIKLSLSFLLAQTPYAFPSDSEDVVGINELGVGFRIRSACGPFTLVETLAAKS